jgi:hypothetical protein
MNREYEIHVALENKPPMDTPCNHCGWCCLRETCDLGQLVTPDGGECTQLVRSGGKYYCNLANNSSARVWLHIDEGCNAISVGEKLKMLGLVA